MRNDTELLDSILGIDPSLRVRKKVEAPEALRVPETYSPKMTNDEFYWSVVAENPDDPTCFCSRCIAARKRKWSLFYAVFGDDATGPTDRRLPGIAPERFVTLGGSICRLCRKALSGETHIDHEPTVKWLSTHRDYRGPVILHPTHASCNLAKGSESLGDAWVRRVLAEEAVEYSAVRRGRRRNAPSEITVESVMRRIMLRARNGISPSDVIDQLRARGFDVSADDGVVKRARRSLGVRTVRVGRSYLWYWDGQTVATGHEVKRESQL